jgi:hypothetical protein
LKKIIVCFGILFFSVGALAQVQFSIGTDLSVLHNFSPKQQFFAIGQTVQGNLHFNKKQSAYAWISYFSPGKFKNDFSSAAISPVTSPALITYRVTGKFRYREISLGWKHYFKGSFDEEKKWNLYGIAGFGLMFSRVENVFSSPVDTTLYHAVYPLQGSNSFQRLTIDLGLGAEIPVGGDFYLYGDVRTWVPTTSYPSPYLHKNNNVPLPLVVSAGIRILFATGTVY